MLTGLHLIDRDSFKHIDVLTLVLLAKYEFTYLPELYDIYGEENFVKFLDLFGGKTIKVPSNEEFSNACRDVRIYVSMKRRDDDQVANDLADLYLITPDMVRKIFKSMQELCEKRFAVVYEPEKSKR